MNRIGALTKEGVQTAYLRVQVLALYNVSEKIFRSYFGLNLNPIKPVLTLGISRCRQISNLCLYRSLAKRDTALNYRAIIGLLGLIALDNSPLVEVIFKKYLYV